MDRIAIVDIDAHQGNGTQEIFWDRPDVIYASVHVDPAPAGSRTSSDTPTRRAAAAARARPQRARGARNRRRRMARCTRTTARMKRGPPTRSSSRSVSMPPPTIPRARCASPATASVQPAGRSATWVGRPSSCRRAATTCRRSAARARGAARRRGDCRLGVMVRTCQRRTAWEESCRTATGRLPGGAP